MTTAAGQAGFAYRARHRAGGAYAGTIEAVSAEDAGRKLAALGLEVEGEVTRTHEGGFEPQRAQRTATEAQRDGGTGGQREVGAGLGWRLRRVAAAAAAAARGGEDVEGAVASWLPNAYCAVAAGARQGKLGEGLLLLQKHFGRVWRIRGAVWRMWAYPAVLAGLYLALWMAISLAIIPTYMDIFRDFRTNLPWLTEELIEIAMVLPTVVGVGLWVVGGLVVAWQLTRIGGMRGWLMDELVVPLPRVGEVARSHIYARWYGALAAAIGAGAAPREALEMAGKASGSRRLVMEGAMLAEAWEAAGNVGQARPLTGMRMLPGTVLTLLGLGEMGAGRNVGQARPLTASGAMELSGALTELADLCAYEAAEGAKAWQAVVAPVFVCLSGVTVAMVMVAMILPLVPVHHLSGGEGG